MTVSIDIDLDAMDAIQEIGSLKLALESLDDDLEFDLDLDGGLGDVLDELSEKMGELSDSFTNDLNETIDRLEGLEFDDIEVVGGGDSGGDTGSDSGDFDASARRYYSDSVFKDDRDDPSSIRQALNHFGTEATDVADFSSVADRFGSTEGDSSSDFDRRKLLDFKMFGGEGGSIRPPGAGGSSGDSDSGRGGLGGMLRSITQKSTRLDGTAGSLKKRFKKLIPSMSTWINLVGMAIPALGAMAVQAAGVAAAMGSMALAGAGIIGLGLIGHGDSMAESFRNAGNQVDELKQSLFDTFEPAADLFAPTQAEFFDFVPGQMERISNSMEGLLVYKDDIFELFRGGTQFASEFLQIITGNEQKIGEMTDTFSRLVGSSILDLFQWLLDVGYRNQEMLVGLSKVLMTLGVTMFNVFMVIGKTVMMLSGLFKIFSFISKLLNNSLVAGMLAIVAVLYMASSAAAIFGGALGMVATVLSTGLIPGFSSMFVWLSSYIFQTLTATMANYGLAASIANVTAALGTLLAMSGIGLLVAGLGLGIGKLTGMLDLGSTGGPGSRGVGGSGLGGSRGGTTVINEGDRVNVDISKADNESIQRFADLGSSGGGTQGPTGGSYTGN